MDEKTKDVAEQLALRARQPQDVSAAEYRRLFILGLAYLLREVDSISYHLRNKGGAR
jgi:hypothetical protein